MSFSFQESQQQLRFRRARQVLELNGSACLPFLCEPEIAQLPLVVRFYQEYEFLVIVRTMLLGMSHQAGQGVAPFNLFKKNNLHICCVDGQLYNSFGLNAFQ